MHQHQEIHFQNRERMENNMAKTVKRGMFLQVYGDLINLSPKVLAGAKNEPLMVETLLYEIIDLSPEVLLKRSNSR